MLGAGILAARDAQGCLAAGSWEGLAGSSRREEEGVGRDLRAHIWLPPGSTPSVPLSGCRYCAVQGEMQRWKAALGGLAVLVSGSTPSGPPPANPVGAAVGAEERGKGAGCCCCAALRRALCTGVCSPHVAVIDEVKRAGVRGRACWHHDVIKKLMVWWLWVQKELRGPPCWPRYGRQPLPRSTRAIWWRRRGGGRRRARRAQRAQQVQRSRSGAGLLRNGRH